MIRHSIAGLLTLLLTACGGESLPVDPQSALATQDSGLDQVPDAGPCDRLASAEWIVEAACTGCSVADAPAAIDGDDRTRARVSFAPQVGRPGGAAIRAHAPPGVVYTAGRAATAFVHEPDTMLEYDIEVRTYLGGVLQESRKLGGTGRTSSAPEAVTGFVTDKPFDAVEYYLNVISAPTEAVGEIVELCLDGA